MLGDRCISMGLSCGHPGVMMDTYGANSKLHDTMKSINLSKVTMVSLYTIMCIHEGSTNEIFKLNTAWCSSFDFDMVECVQANT